MRLSNLNLKLIFFLSSTRDVMRRDVNTQYKETIFWHDSNLYAYIISRINDIFLYRFYIKRIFFQLHDFIEANFRAYFYIFIRRSVHTNISTVPVSTSSLLNRVFWTVLPFSFFGSLGNFINEISLGESRSTHTYSARMNTIHLFFYTCRYR